MTARLWLCIGGPLHGQYRPAAASLHVPMFEPVKVSYWEDRWTGLARVAVPEPRQINYYPTRMALPGWVVSLTIWAEAGIAAGSARLEAGSVLPGGIQGERREAHRCCRWCFGDRAWNPMVETCGRPACINNWASVQALDAINWKDEP